MKELYRTESESFCADRIFEETDGFALQSFLLLWAFILAGHKLSKTR